MPRRALYWCAPRCSGWPGYTRKRSRFRLRSRPTLVCIETDDLGAAGLTGEQFGALISGAGRAGMREWLERLAPALRAIFVLRAVAGQDGEQTAESLRQSGATGAQAWRRDQVGTAYRQALCSLATCLMSAQTALMPA